MNVVKVLLLAVLAAGVAQPARAITGDKAEFKQIADDVYAFVGKLNDANALVVVTAQGVGVVDTGNNPPETRVLQNFIRSVTAQPVRYVIVSQNHGDHTGGTPLFAPPANVIIHERVAKDWARAQAASGQILAHALPRACGRAQGHPSARHRAGLQ